MTAPSTTPRTTAGPATDTARTGPTTVGTAPATPVRATAGTARTATGTGTADTALGTAPAGTAAATGAADTAPGTAPADAATGTAARPAVPGFPTLDAPLQRLLRLDAGATAVAGLLGLLLPVSVFGDLPALLPRAVGAALVLVGADLALASRWSGRRLRRATAVCADLALAWVAATVVVLAVHDLPAAGVEVLGLVGLVTLGFGVSELRALRRR